MAEFTGRDLHLVKKALAIAVLAIERQPGPFQSASDQSDMNPHSPSKSLISLS
ncbi:MAG: hypothetical protein V4514_14555 [Pseudomonadota bacterium]|uniref:hypothetical protein n=1 Tax=Phenylobacterium sp. TaxID=1871053 RepID=UPI0025D7C885|nr:hypothetical protein [Phenylobacterium sp.]MBT9472603.1 hypothetical protein [Phenylobacterium sp.]